MQCSPEIDASTAFLSAANRLGFSVTDVSKAVGVDLSHIYRSAKGAVGMSGPTIMALRLTVGAIESRFIAYQGPEPQEYAQAGYKVRYGAAKRERRSGLVWNNG